MQVEDSLGHVKVMANGLVLAYSCREGVPGFFGLDSKKVYYLFKSVEATRLGIYVCKCNALFLRIFTLHDQEHMNKAHSRPAFHRFLPCTHFFISFTIITPTPSDLSQPIIHASLQNRGKSYN